MKAIKLQTHKKKINSFNLINKTIISGQWDTTTRFKVTDWKKIFTTDMTEKEPSGFP